MESLDAGAGAGVGDGNGYDRILSRHIDKAETECEEGLESKYRAALERIATLERTVQNLQARLKSHTQSSTLSPLLCHPTETRPENDEHLVLIEQTKASFAPFQHITEEVTTTYVPYGKSVRKIPHKARRAVIIKLKTEPPPFGKGKYANGQLARQCLYADCSKRGMPQFDKMCHGCYQSLNPTLVSKYKGRNKCATLDCPKRNQGRKYQGYCVQCFKINFPGEQVPYEPCRADGCAKRGKNGQFKGYCHTCFQLLFPGQIVKKTRAPCAMDGCSMLTPAKAWEGLCIACFKKTGRKMPENYFCISAGCNKAKEKRGYCIQHFREMHPEEQPWTTCAIGGCQKNGQGKKFGGMCRACFNHRNKTQATEKQHTTPKETHRTETNDNEQRTAKDTDQGT